MRRIPRVLSWGADGEQKTRREPLRCPRRVDNNWSTSPPDFG